MRQKQEAAEAKKAEAAANGVELEKKGPTQAEKKHAKAVALATSGKQKWPSAVEVGGISKSDVKTKGFQIRRSRRAS